MKLTCAVTRDLLPLYAEDMTEPETRALVGEHLAECGECRRRLEEILAGSITPQESTEPLKALKKEIRRRRWITAAIAALCALIAVFTFFYHESSMRPVPWEEGLIEVTGVETRPLEDVYEGSADEAAPGGDTQVLIVRTDSRINGTREMMVREDDGTMTVLLQGWSSNPDRRSAVREYGEMVFAPVPDRLIYDGGDHQELLWGEAMNGGVEVLPRLALTYYLLIALVLAAVTGFAWFILRKRRSGTIARQLFFAPAAWVIAHFLIKGTKSASFFIGRDLIGILVMAAAVYALLTLVWAGWITRRNARESAG